MSKKTADEIEEEFEEEFEEESEEESDESDEAVERPVNMTLARIKVTIASVGYVFLVFIVIYGLTDGVYNGFPSFVPYVIITVFLMMSFVRMYQGLTGKIPAKKKKKNWWQKLFQRHEDAEEETQDDEDENEYEEDYEEE